MITQIKTGLLVLLLACATTVAMAAPTLHIGANPTALKISYGAKKTTSMILQYDLVSDLPNKSQNLSNIRFTSKHASANISVHAISNTCGGVLPPQGSTGVCSINVPISAEGVQPPSTTALASAKYHLKFTYGNGRATTLTSPDVSVSFATGKKIDTASRTFTFNNHCDHAIWIGINSGATNSIHPITDAQSCHTDSDCYPGSVCQLVDATSGLKHCFWTNPATADNSYKLDAKGGVKTTNSITIPVYDNGIESIWSGGIAGRSGCTNSVCETGDCVDPLKQGHDGACELTKGFAAPVSTTEFTLLASNSLVNSNTLNGNTVTDTYDATVINGVTTALSMTPVNGVWGGRSKPYTCGVGGAATNTQSSAACNWDGFVVPDYTYVFVKYDATAIDCTTDAICGLNHKCGSSFNPVGSLVLSGKCGVPLGYWTADGICAKQANYKNATNGIDCTGVVGPGAATQAELYGCTGDPYKNSCYSAGAVSQQCCGCVDWHTIPGINVPQTPITESCDHISSTPWVTDSQPKLEWLKKACPNAYVYPFDDASSTFTCAKLNAETVNQVNYTINFCPIV